MNSKIIFFLAILFFPIFIHAQAKIKFDTTVYDLGIFTQSSGEIEKDIKFMNNGTEPLVIQQASTGDGGSMAEYPKEPIAPGKTGSIRFIYDANRIGKFNRSVSISSNANPYYTTITVKGEVIYKRTQITVSENEKNIGNLNFGETDTVEFIVTNSGDSPLYVSFNSYNYPDDDLLMMNVQSPKKTETPKINSELQKQETFYRGEIYKIKFVLRNIYGNTGKFQRKLFFTYNSHDTLLFLVDGNFTGNPFMEKIVEGTGSISSVYYYENKMLVRKEIYDKEGALIGQDFYSGSYCIQKKSQSMESFYKE